MRYNIVTPLLLLALAGCANSPAVPAPSPEASASPTASAAPDTPASPAAPAQPEASPSAPAVTPPANGAPVELEHSITVKKDGVPLQLASLSTRTLTDNTLRFAFGMKNESVGSGEYGLMFGYSTTGKSPAADGLQLSDLSPEGLVVVTLYEGTGSLPKRYVGKPRSTPAVKELSVSGGKLNFTFKGELVPFPGINPDPSFMLEVEIKDAPLN